MPDPEKTTITIESAFGSKLTMVIPFDTDLAEWQNIFKVILMFMTFDEDSIKEIFPQAKIDE
jgi:hypothetical protein